MNKPISFGALMFVSAVGVSGCDVIEGIFKAGVWVGVLAVVAVIAVIVWIIAKVRS